MILSREQKSLIKSCSQVKQICEPIFSTFAINLFQYTQIDYLGRGFGLCTNAEWLKYGWENQIEQQTEGAPVLLLKNVLLILMIAKKIVLLKKTMFYH